MSTIVHLFGAMDTGGAELRMLELLQLRQQRDQQHVFVTLSGRAGELASDFERAGCEVVPRQLSWTFPFWFFRFLRKRRATHLHSHVHLASGYFLAIGSCAGVRRRVAHIRSSADGKETSFFRGMYRLAGRYLLALFATDVVAVSKAALTPVLGAAPRGVGKYKVLYGQIAGARFGLAGPAVRSRAHILVVGRLDHDKNPIRALEISACFMDRNRGFDTLVRFVGRSTQQESTALIRRATELGIEDHVSIFGVRTDIPELLAASDLLVSTSLREGLSGATIEAAAAGLPSVVSAILPNEELCSVLPSVVPVPLEAGNSVWSDVILDVLAERRQRLAPTAIRSWFDQSPFALGDQKEWDRLWS